MSTIYKLRPRTKEARTTHDFYQTFTTNACSFPKEKRFSYKLPDTDSPMTILPSTKADRSTSFGRGERSDPAKFKGFDAPGPNYYDPEKNQFKLIVKDGSCNFGHSHSSAERLYVKKGKNSEQADAFY